MLDKPAHTVQLIVHESDVPTIERGSLIPSPYAAPATGGGRSGERLVLVLSPLRRPLLVVVLSAFLFAVGFGSATYVFPKEVPVAGQAQVAAPIVTVLPDSGEPTATAELLAYGPQPRLTDDAFYRQLRTSLVDAKQTFLEIDMVDAEVRSVVAGVLQQTAPMTQTPAAGSWWQLSAGLYQVSSTHEAFFSPVAQATFPHTVRFAENFMLHGPSVSAAAGGVAVASSTAAAIFATAAVDMPVLVRTAVVPAEGFTYQPPVATARAEQYFAADITTGAVLASSNMSEPAAIASLTKLMTALVAVEQIDLDQVVTVQRWHLVESPVPRLQIGQRVSMYELLQLLLTESSNEAAEVIAGQLGRAAFIAAMNERAVALGMASTTFADPSGLADGNVSVTADLFTLTKYIYEQRPFIIELTRDGRLPAARAAGRFANVRNFNELPGMTGVVGGKIGYTPAAGQTSISLHTLVVDDVPRTVVVIVLGSENRVRDVSTVVSFLEQQFGG